MTAATEQHHQYERVYVWEWPVRLAHWLIVLSIVVLSVTGYYIGNPYWPVGGEASRHFVMGYVKSVHFAFGMVFAVSVLARIFWMFAGNPYARWNELVPTRLERIKGIWETFSFYIFLNRDSPAFVGHNPLAGAVYVVVFTLCLVMIGTGLALASASALLGTILSGLDFLIPLFGGLQMARWIHHICMWLLLGFAAHHVWSAYLVGTVERSSLMDSIFSGYKTLPPDIAKRARRHIEEDK